MKNLKLILTTLLVGITNCLYGHAESQQFVLSFSLEDFEIANTNNGLLSISSSVRNVSYAEDNTPALPILTNIIALAGDCELSNYTVNFSKKLIRNNVNLEQNSLPYPTDFPSSNTAFKREPYKALTYPSTNVEFAGSSNWDDISLLYFQASPFVYDANLKKLYFIEEIYLNIDYKKSNSTGGRQYHAVPEELAQNALNYNEIFENNLSTKGGHEVNLEKDCFEYLIVTSDKLKDSFKPLAEWKLIKGIRSKIVTTEEIAACSDGMTLPIKIKNYLRKMHDEFGMQYALLGGDASVVPAFYVRCTVGKYTKYIPSDAFYACFQGDFLWNKNGNSINGEEDDGINFTHDIYVTRALVNTPNEAMSFVNKTLGYEKSPKWNNNMLMSGVMTDSIFPSGKSDSDVQGHMLYNTAIYPLWTGIKHDFYDTSTSFTGGENYDVTSSNLQSKLSNGYSFVHMDTHGSKGSWAMEKGFSYNSSYANALNNPYHSVILTSACFTNAIDSLANSSSSLSKSFSINSNSGIIAYFGSSSYGWGTTSTTRLGSSLKYEDQFFRLLFPSKSIYNYGKINAIAKMNLIAESWTSNPMRWLQFSINPIGDPEMPIFTDTPHSFENVTCMVNKYYYALRTNEEGCKITIMSKDDLGSTYYKIYENVSSLTFSIPVDCFVCITKHNFIPYLETYKANSQTIIGPIEYGAFKIRSCNPNPVSANTLISIDRPIEDHQGFISITDLNGNVKKGINVPIDEQEISVDLSGLAQGIYVMNLYIDGILTDTKQIIK